jgi:hypothetical protein
VPLLEGTQASIRDFALTGVWGREVHVTDGHRKYARAPVADNAPLSMWSNRWSTMPVPAFPDLRLPRPDRRARLDYMPGSDVPVIRQPFEPGDPLPFWALGRADEHLLFDLDEDPTEDRNLAGTAAEADAEELLRVALASVDCPDDQLVRLGLS